MGNSSSQAGNATCVLLAKEGCVKALLKQCHHSLQRTSEIRVLALRGLSAICCVAQCIREFEKVKINFQFLFIFAFFSPNFFLIFSDFFFFFFQQFFRIFFFNFFSRFFYSNFSIFLFFFSFIFPIFSEIFRGFFNWEFCVFYFGIRKVWHFNMQKYVLLVLKICSEWSLMHFYWLCTLLIVAVGWFTHSWGTFVQSRFFDWRSHRSCRSSCPNHFTLDQW